MRGDPRVDCASGNYSQSFTDVNVTGRGAGINLRRTYNSIDPSKTGPFGYGWTSTYDQKLLLPDASRTDNSVVVLLEDGSQIIATPTAGGGYSTPVASDSDFRSNGDGTYTLVRSKTLVQRYSASGRLISIADLNGEATTLDYDSDGRLSKVTEAGERALRVTTDTSGRVTSVTDPIGRTTDYTYDAAGDLTTVTAPLGRTWTFTYGSAHRMLTVTSPRGGVLTNTYDSAGRVTKQVDPVGLTTELTFTGDNYSSMGGLTTVKDPHGAVTTATFANGFMFKQTTGVGTPSERVRQYTYDPSTYGIATETDPKGRVTKKTYDDRGRVTSVTNALGRTSSFTYNEIGLQTTATTPSGAVTAASYDARGNLLSATDATGRTATAKHEDPQHPGDTTSMTDRDGRRVEMTYDTYGNLASRTVHPTATTTGTVRWAYNLNGQQTCVAPASAVTAKVACRADGTPVAKTVTTVYDGAGRPISTVDPSNRSSSSVYDPDDNVTQETDPTGHTTTTTFDLDGRPSSERKDATAGAESTVRIAYDIAAGSSGCPSEASFCETRTDPANGRTLRAFDVLGQEYLTRSPGGESIRRTYDPVGSVTSVTSDSGTTKTLTRDDGDHLMSITYSDDTPDVHFTYDDDGHRTSMEDGSGTTGYVYDAGGRPTSVTNGAGAQIAYEYDGRGDATKITYPGGREVLRAYDGAAQLIGVTDWRGKATAFKYNADGEVTSTKYPNGTEVKSSFDPNGNLSRAALMRGPSELASLAYKRSPSGLITNEQPLGLHAGAREYRYDGREQLVEAGTDRFAYDLAGRLSGLNGATQAFTPSGRLSSTTAALTTSFEYDANGDRTARVPGLGRTVRHRYDGAHRLTGSEAEPSRPQISAVSPSNGATAGGTSVTLTGTGLSELESIRFGTVAGTNLNVISDTRVQVTTPPQSSGLAAIVASGRGGDSPVTSVAQFRYNPRPAVTEMVPAAGPRSGGTAVTISGREFTDVEAVLFGGVAALRFTIESDSRITAVAPAGAGNLAVTLKTSKYTSAGGPAAAFTYADGPAVTAVAPARGLLDGTRVTVRGAGFANATTMTLDNDSVPFHIVSDTEITATLPAGTGARHIRISSPAGVSEARTSDVFTYVKAPTVARMVPSSGRTDGGTTVTLTGTGFQPNATRAKVGGAPAVIRVLSSTSALVVTPPGAGSQPVTISTDGGTGQSAGTFRYAKPASAFVYDGDDRRMSRVIDGTRVPFTWDGTALIGDGDNAYVYGPGGIPIEQVDGEGRAHYFFLDAIGSTRALTDEAGDVAATFAYTSYGELEQHTGQAFTRLLFGRGYLDADTGLTYLVNRYYDGSTGQFLTVDPAEADTGDPYGYASGDPINGLDPLGLSFWSVTKKIWKPVAGVALFAAGAACVASVACGAGVGGAVLATEFLLSMSDAMVACAPPRDGCGREIAEGGVEFGLTHVGAGISGAGKMMETKGYVPLGKAAERYLKGHDAVTSSGYVIGDTVKAIRELMPPPPPIIALPPQAAPGPIAVFRGTVSAPTVRYPVQNTANPQGRNYSPQQPARVTLQGGGALQYRGPLTVTIARPGCCLRVR